jgi:hypothetical protein
MDLLAAILFAVTESPTMLRLAHANGSLEGRR